MGCEREVIITKEKRNLALESNGRQGMPRLIMSPICIAHICQIAYNVWSNNPLVVYQSASHNIAKHLM